VSCPSLDWSDPIAVSKWLAGLRLAFNDADAVALDMLRPPRVRELGPALHAKNYGEARAQILQSLAYAAKLPDAAPHPASSMAAPPTCGPLAARGAPVKRGKGLRALVRAIDATKGRPADEARDDVAALPLAGVLFLAMIGTPGERADVDSPLVLVLDAIRDTIEGWARTPSTSTAYAHVPVGELDRLSHRVGAAIVIARRMGKEGGAS
jgi:hypothetical protein